MCLLGVTTVIDGGSAGSMTFQGLKKYICEPSKTRVLAFLNIACHGLGMFSHKISIITIFDLKHLTFNRKTYLIVTYHIKNFLVEFHMAIA